MAAVSGNPIPFHLPSAIVTATTYTVTSDLGLISAQPTGAAAYTLPLVSSVLEGSSVTISNPSAFTVTVNAAAGNTINGSASLALRSGSFCKFTVPAAGTDWIADGVRTIGGVVVSGPATAVTQLTSNTTAVTVNANGGKVTMFGALSTAALAISSSFTVNNSFVTANSSVTASVSGYTGTDVTNGVPFAIVRAVAAGSFTLQIYNAHTANALSGTCTISFSVI